jgi:Histidine kinase-, DNA gyrase B-, and HSP90-like ATPase
MTNHDIVPPHLVVKAMRDSGYRNAAYAIAELIDNSIQAGATRVELLCGERRQLVRQRERTQVSEIAVLDNGSGMDAETLRMALQFGNGTRLDDRSGIGRFGMGLPNSSISQARRVDVWSWQDGVENAIPSYLDIDEITDGRLKQVPEPQPKSIPQLWLNVGTCFEQSGTLVVWSSIDLSMWSTARKIIENSELVIGRIYRYFLENGYVSIRMLSFDMNARSLMPDERYAKPNDPLYLMDVTSCPSPFDNVPMFQQWGEGDMVYHVRYRGEIHEVRLRFSYAKEEAREGFNPGDRPYGKHAAKNVGVSIVRAGRELDLDPSWSNPSEPRDRWWGVEVHFPPALDELFGVTNNKQSARNFAELAKVNLDDLLDEGQTLGTVRDYLEADEDPRWPLLEIAHQIRKNVDVIRGLVKAQTAGARGTQTRYQGNMAPEVKATEATRKRIDEGRQGTSDIQETQMAPQVREEEIKEELVEQGVMRTTAEDLAASTVGRGLKYTFAHAMSSSAAFFDVKSRGGAIIVTLNTSHPAYEHLIEVLEEELEEADVETLKSRLIRARDGLKLLLTAWARYEDEQSDKQRSRVQDARWDWGRMARDFLEGEE